MADIVVSIIRDQPISLGVSWVARRPIFGLDSLQSRLTSASACSGVEPPTSPDPETRTLEKPKARNLLAISALLANCSTELRARVARYRFPWWTINLAGEAPIDVDGGSTVEALPKVP